MGAPIGSMTVGQLLGGACLGLVVSVVMLLLTEVFSDRGADRDNDDDR